jgi:hypothetical protein
MLAPESATGAPIVAAAETSAAETAADQTRATARPDRRWVIGYATAAIVLFLCYLRLSMTQAVSSDGASNALQAWDMLHGNPLLRGWTLTDVSFYTTELPEHMFIEAIIGLSPMVVHIGAAVSYTLIVLGGGWLAKGRATGREGLLRVLIASGIMVAPQLGTGTWILLLAPDHTGTSVPLLVTWLVLDRAPRGEGGKGSGWGLPVVVGVLLTWAVVGDRIALLLGVAPLVIVCSVRAYRGIVQRGWPAARCRLELSLLAAGAASAAAASLVVRAIQAAGGYRLQPMRSQFATEKSMSPNIWRTVDGLLSLFGGDFFTASPVSPAPHAVLAVVFVLAHLVGLAMAVVAVWLATRRFFRSDDLLVSILTVAVLLNLIAFVVSSLPSGPWSTRQIAGVLPAGAVLAGRLLAGPVLRRRLQPVLAVVLVGYLAALGQGLTAPTHPAVGQDLAAWLEKHHLSYGLSGYGFANTTTLASDGRVALRPAAWTPYRVSPGPEEYKMSWYDPQAHYADFVVLGAVPLEFDPMTPAWATRIFGRSSHVYRYRQYIIMTWKENLLERLRPGEVITGTDRTNLSYLTGASHLAAPPHQSRVWRDLTYPPYVSRITAAFH